MALKVILINKERTRQAHLTLQAQLDMTVPLINEMMIGSGHRVTKFGLNDKLFDALEAADLLPDFEAGEPYTGMRQMSKRLRK